MSFLIKYLLGISMFLFSGSTIYAQTRKATVQTKRKAVSAQGKSPAASIARGKVVYSKYCLTCHQADGGGVPNMNPPLIKTSYVMGDKSTPIRIVLQGLDREIEINGDTYVNPMPAHDFLKDQEIADVLTYVRNSFGNKASAVTVAEVQKLRKK